MPKNELKILILSLFLLVLFPNPGYAYKFISTQKDLECYFERTNVVMVASPGRSASTLLTQTLQKHSEKKIYVLKSHLLPPDQRYKGKILFIFSNPDKAAESALHMTLRWKSFGNLHFEHVETSDHEWLTKIGNAKLQTQEDNLLSYDALGCRDQLYHWLVALRPTSPKNAQVLSIKYEDLWEPRTLQAIKTFLNIHTLDFPPKRERGCKDDNLTENDILFRKIYNKGSKEDPYYSAYDDARGIWEKARSFQFFQLKSP